jgi:hypothetical protein
MKKRILSLLVATFLVVSALSIPVLAIVGGMTAETVNYAVRFSRSSSYPGNSWGSYLQPTLQYASTNTTYTESGFTVYRNNVTVNIPSDTTYFMLRWKLNGVTAQAPFYYYGASPIFDGGAAGYATFDAWDYSGPITVRMWDTRSSPWRGYEVRFTINFV